MVSPRSRADLAVEVVLGGASVPQATTVLNTTDPEICGREHTLDDLVIDAENRGVRDVVAILRPAAAGFEAPPPTPPLAPFVLDNRDCRFEPHARVVGVGTVLEVVNSDDVLHTVHLYGPRERNLALPTRGSRQSFALEEPGLYLVRCDVHGWMQAFIRVVDESFYALSDEAGRLRIEGAPAGDALLELWHERLGSRRAEVRVDPAASSPVRIDYSLEAP